MLQSCPTLRNPINRSPPGSAIPGILQARNTGVGCHFLLQCMKVESESEVAQSCLTLCDPMDCSLPGSSIHGFSRQEYWRGVPLPSPNWRLITYNIVLVLPYINMNPPRVYTCSPSGTPLLASTPYHTFGSSQCTSPEHPVSCMEPGLAIHFTYDNIHVSTLPSQIIPPLPSPTESKRLFFTSVSLLLSRI